MATAALAAIMAATAPAWASDAEMAAATDPASAPMGPAPAAVTDASTGAALAEAAATGATFATDIIGATVFVPTPDGKTEKIGEISDLVVGPDGSALVAVVGVGGYLGIGGKDIAVAYPDLELHATGDERWLIAPGLTRAHIETDPGFDRQEYVASSSLPEIGVTDPAVGTTASIRTSEFVGEAVYGADGEEVGEVGDVVLGTDGEVKSVVIDVGGFLGIGTKEVAVGMESVTLTMNADGDRELRTMLTREDLERHPAHDPGTLPSE